MKIDKENKTGTIILSAGHSVIMPHKPGKLPINLISDKCMNDSGAELLNFGLFDYATPNYSTYYPDVTAEDLEPKEEEFILPVFRMLSEVIVAKYAPIDFSQNGVLKKSMKMLLGQTVYIDHEVAVGNAIGAVAEVFWQESYKSKDGIKVPAGINAVLKIDGKSNPRIARGIMMKPPSIHSNSVTVRFKWEPSHEFDDVSEFYNKVGTYNKDGELIRLIVTEILAYHETSLVQHGADAFAQKVNEDGEINDPKYASRVYQFTQDKPVSGHINFDYKSETFSLSADKTSPVPTNNNLNNNPKTSFSMDEIIKQLSTNLGFEDGVLTEENLAEKVSELFTEKETAITNLNSEKDRLEIENSQLSDDKSNLESELQTAKGNNDSAEQILKNTKAEAVRLYKLAKGEDADETIVNLINNTSDLETVKSFLLQYQGETEEEFAGKCDECGSTKVTRMSAQTTKDGLVAGKGPDEEEESSEKTNLEVADSLKTKFKKKSRIFDKK